MSAAKKKPAKVAPFPPLETRLEAARRAAQKDPYIRKALEWWFDRRLNGVSPSGVSDAEWLKQNPPPPATRADAERVNEKFFADIKRSSALLQASERALARRVREQMKPRASRKGGK